MANKQSLIIALLSALIGLSVLFGILIVTNQELLHSIIRQAEDEPIKKVELQIPATVEKQKDFRLLKYQNSDDMYLLDGWDKVIAIESLNKACGTPVMEYIGDTINQRFWLTDLNHGADMPIRNIYKIDTDTLTCTRMKISSELGDFGGYRTSPDNTKLAISTESNPRVLKVLDLVNDTVKVVATAGPNETFNAGWGGLSNNFVFIWTDNETIQYDTFREVSYAERTPDGGKPLISTEVVRIK